MLAVVEQLPRLGKRELICLLWFTCNNVFSVGEASSSSGRILLWHSLSLPYNLFAGVSPALSKGSCESFQIFQEVSRLTNLGIIMLFYHNYVFAGIQRIKE